MFDHGSCAGLPLRRSDAVRPFCGGIACGGDGVAFDYAVGGQCGWGRLGGEASSEETGNGNAVQHA